MNPPEAIGKRLDDAHDLQDVLAAGWEAFDRIRRVATVRAHGDHGSYATWMSVIPPACEGRDALDRAPSMPADQDRHVRSEDYATDDQAAHDIAALAEILSQRLRADKIARNVADRQAIERATLAAAEIIGLLADED